MDIRIELVTPGGVECLQVANCMPGTPGPQEVCIRHEAIGVNFLDIYQRTGLYALPLPAVLGVEGAGVVEAVGAEVVDLKVGDRVAYAGVPGGYAATRLLPAWRAIRLPAEVDSRTAAASMLRGLTVHMLLTRTYPVKHGTLMLVHAAAGGLGSALTRWAKHLGCLVIGAVGSEEKAAIARRHGADQVIVGRGADFVAEVGRLTEGRGVDFAVDGIGSDTLAKTLGCVRRFGTVASVGQAAGPIPPVPVEALGPQRSLTLARHSVMAYASEPETYRTASRAVLDAIRSGILLTTANEYPLREAARAHRAIESGETTGSLILVP